MLTRLLQLVADVLVWSVAFILAVPIVIVIVLIGLPQASGLVVVSIFVYGLVNISPIALALSFATFFLWLWQIEILNQYDKTSSEIR